MSDKEYRRVISNKWAMNKKRFTIVTFRGYDESEYYDTAIEKAKMMVKGIKFDKWCEEYWWARVLDNYKGRSRLIWLRGNYQWSLTQWLALTNM